MFPSNQATITLLLTKFRSASPYMVYGIYGTIYGNTFRAGRTVFRFARVRRWRIARTAKSVPSGIWQACGTSTPFWAQSEVLMFLFSVRPDQCSTCSPLLDISFDSASAALSRTIIMFISQAPTYPSLPASVYFGWAPFLSARQKLISTLWIQGARPYISLGWRMRQSSR